MKPRYREADRIRLGVLAREKEVAEARLDKRIARWRRRALVETLAIAAWAAMVGCWWGQFPAWVAVVTGAFHAAALVLNVRIAVAYRRLFGVWPW